MNRFLQSVIASCGVFISGMLGWITVDSENQATQIQKEQARLAFLDVFTEQTSAAMRDCNPTLLAFLENAIERLPHETEDEVQEQQMYRLYYDRTVNMIDRCTLEKLAAAQSEQPEALMMPAVTRVAQNVALQAGEAAAAEPEPMPAAPAASAAPSEPGAAPEAVAAATPAAPPADERWLAVLASYEVGHDERAAIQDLQKFRTALAALGDPDLSVQAYVTRVSNHYALVLGSTETDRDAANRLAALARTNGWAGDAFAQLDRDWTLCMQADTEDALRACAPAAGTALRE